MPYKKGPNNTVRYYSSTTGKYAPDPYLMERLLLLDKSKFKLSKQEQNEIRRQSIKNRASRSQDKYVSDLYNFLESNKPGCVKLINEKIYHEVWSWV